MDKEKIRGHGVALRVKTEAGEGLSVKSSNIIWLYGVKGRYGRPRGQLKNYHSNGKDARRAGRHSDN